jgi:hypothetical protein
LPPRKPRWVGSRAEQQAHTTPHGKIHHIWRRGVRWREGATWSRKCALTPSALTLVITLWIEPQYLHRQRKGRGDEK